MAEDKLVVKLFGEDGNILIIMGACSEAMKQAGWSEERREAVLEKMHEVAAATLLLVAMKHFDVE